MFASSIVSGWEDLEFSAVGDAVKLLLFQFNIVFSKKKHYFTSSSYSFFIALVDGNKRSIWLRLRFIL